jgi:hypothetical protein
LAEVDQTPISVLGMTGGPQAAAAAQGGGQQKAPVQLTPAGLSIRKGKKGQTLKLSEITRPLSESTKKIMMLGKFFAVVLD